VGPNEGQAGESKLWNIVRGRIPLFHQVVDEHDLLRQRPSSLLTEWSSTFITYMMMWSIYLNLLRDYCRSEFGCDVTDWRCAPPHLTCLDNRDEYADGGLWYWSQWKDQSVQCRLDHFHKVYSTNPVSSSLNHNLQAKGNWKSAMGAEEIWYCAWKGPC
jgi:hypothetical protein